MSSDLMATVWKQEAWAKERVAEGQFDIYEYSSMLQGVINSPVVKFKVLLDLGIIQVPDDYIHAMYVQAFVRENAQYFHPFDRRIQDNKYPAPSKFLGRGIRLYVRVFRQVVLGPTTFDERIKFLSEQGSFHLGVHGEFLAWERWKDELTRERAYSYASLDHRDHLHNPDFKGELVPTISFHQGCAPRFDLVRADEKLGLKDAFFCFTEV